MRARRRFDFIAKQIVLINLCCQRSADSRPSLAGLDVRGAPPSRPARRLPPLRHRLLNARRASSRARGHHRHTPRAHLRATNMRVSAARVNAAPLRRRTGAASSRTAARSSRATLRSDLRGRALGARGCRDIVANSALIGGARATVGKV